MNKMIRQHLDEVAQLSDAARELAQRVVEASASRKVLRAQASVDVALPEPTDEQSLLDKLDALQARTQDLQAALDDALHPDAKFTDAEGAAFIESFNQGLKTLNAAQIEQLYTRAYFSVYPKNIRALVATCLVNEFDSRALVPLDLWVSLIAKNGAL